MKPFYLVMICLVVFMFGCTPVQTVNGQGRSSTIYKPKRSCGTRYLACTVHPSEVLVWSDFEILELPLRVLH